MPSTPAAPATRSRPRTRCGVLAALGATMLLVAIVPLAGAGQADHRFYLGMSLHFTGPDTTAGTFVVSGALEDSGTSSVENIAIVPIGSGDKANLSGDQTFSGSKGTIVTHFQGVAFPLSSPHQVGRGHVEILSGTGAYVGVGGHATFLIVVDALSNQLIGTEEGSVNH